MSTSTPVSATSRFSLVIDALHSVVAAQFRSATMTVAMIVLICGHLRRVERRVLALVAAIRAGTLRVGHGCGGRRGPRGAAAAAGPTLPRGYAWLVVAVPYKVAALAGQLRVVLQDPEMVALIAASPRLVLLLRPLCRMLALEMNVLTPVTTPAPVPPGDMAAVLTEDIAGNDIVRPGVPGSPVTTDATGSVGSWMAPYWGLRFFARA